jgi:hypothetical protein
MISDESVFEFLAKSENLPIALEIASYIERLKKILHERFWMDFNKKIIGYIENSGLNQSWDYDITLRQYAYLKSWGRNSIEPIIKKKGKSPYVFFFIGQTSSEEHYRIWWGVEWSDKPATFQNPSFTKLVDILDHRKTIAGWSKTVRQGLFDYRIYSPDFLLQMNNNPDELVEEISSEFLRIFDEIRPLMEKINKDVTAL